MAQERMKFYADLKCIDREFMVGDWVYLRLQPYRKLSLATHRNLKLFPRFYGPFQVLECIGTVAYRLDLPPDSMIYHVFHVSLLKKKVVDSISPLATLPPVDSRGEFLSELEQIIDRRV